MIPLYEPYLNSKAKENVIECLETNWISSKGRFISEFEHSFSSYFGFGYSCAVSNGTVALHCALLAAGIGLGDKVAVPTFCYVAPVNAVKYVGAEPVFLDCEADTWNVNPDNITDDILRTVQAIIIVHNYGNPIDVKHLRDRCDKHGVVIIEDCAEALANKINGEFVGRFGHISTFSFFGNKTITTGEGGMVCTEDPNFHAKVNLLKSQGVSSHRNYWHDIIGYNYRMTNICASIGLAQLDQLDSIISQKTRIKERYRENLKHLPLTVPKPSHSSVEDIAWLNCFMFESSSKCDRVATALKLAEVETRPLFVPIHNFPMYRSDKKFPIAQSLFERGICLPSAPTLTDQQIDMITEIVTDILN